VITFERLPSLFLMLPVAAMTAFLLYNRLRPAPAGGMKRWRMRFWLWLSRLPGMRKRGSNSGAVTSQTTPHLQGRLALGLRLASYFESNICVDQTLLNQIGWMRRELFLDTGLLMPSISVIQDRSLQPCEYTLHFGAIEVARGSINLGSWLISFEEKPEWVGDRTLDRHPITGAQCLWIASTELTRAIASNCRCEDGLEAFAHHLRSALWQNLTPLVTVEFCQQYLNQGLERSAQIRMFRRELEVNQGRLVALLQLVLALGGSLREPCRVLYLAANGFIQGEPLESIARRVVDSTSRVDPRDNPPPAGLSSALLYSYFWNEHLSSDLISRSDSSTLENLAHGMLEVQNLPPAILEQMWVDTLSHSEIFLLGRSNELGEQLHQMLQADPQGPSRLGKSEQTAILLLSLTKDSGQKMMSILARELNRGKVEEVVQSMGRFGYLLLQAPPGQGGRQLSELGFRERIVNEFLDFAGYRAVPQDSHNLGWVHAWLRQQKDLPVEALAYALEAYYFPSLDPITRLRRAVEHDSKGMTRALVAFAQGESAPMTAAERVPLALQSLHPEVRGGIVGQLRGRGYRLNCTGSASLSQRNSCEWEFFLRVAQPHSRLQSARFRAN